MKLVAAAFAACVLFAAMPAQAVCTCKCVNGVLQPLCQMPDDIEPICPVYECIEELAVPPRPLPSLRIPPIGTTSCRVMRVCEPFGKCSWQEVCR